MEFYELCKTVVTIRVNVSQISTTDEKKTTPIRKTINYLVI